MPPPQQQPSPARAVVGRKCAVLVGVFVVAMTGRLYFETPYLQQILQQQQRQRPQFYTADEDAPLLLRTATPRPKENGTPTTSAAAAATTAAAPGDVGGVTTRNDDRPPVRMTPSTSTTKSTQRKTKKKFFALHIGPSKTGTSTIVSDSVPHRFRCGGRSNPVDSLLRPFSLRFNITCLRFFSCIFIN